MATRYPASIRTGAGSPVNLLASLAMLGHVLGTSLVWAQDDRLRVTRRYLVDFVVPVACLRANSRFTFAVAHRGWLRSVARCAVDRSGL
jgi:hypothetical protein